MEQQLKSLKNNLIFLKNEYLEKLCDIAIDVAKKDKIEIAFVGKLSTGKTTIINALLGKDIMPTGIGTVTKSINTVMKSDENKIEVFYNDERSEIYELDKNAFDSINEKSNLKNVNVYLKEFPFSNVIFVDTPGIDELQQNLENLTISKIPTADAVIFILDISKGITKKDKEFFDSYVVKFLRDKIFIVFNKLDLVKEEVDDYEIQKIKQNLEGFAVFLFSAKEKDQGFTDFKNQLFDYLSNTSKSRIMKARLSSIIKTVEEITKSQLTMLIGNIQKTKEELETRLSELKTKKSELESVIEELKRQVDTEFTEIIKTQIIPIINNKRMEVIEKINSVDPDDLKSYITIKLKQEIQLMMFDIKDVIKKGKEKLEFKNISIDLPDSTLLIISSIDLLKIVDPFLKRFNIPDLTDIIQNIIRKITVSKIESDINEIFDKFQNNIIDLIQSSKDEYFEELKLKEYANIDSEIFSIEKNIEFIGKDKNEIDMEIKFYEGKIKTIEEIISEIKNKLESELI